MVKFFHYEGDDPVPLLSETVEQYHDRIREARNAKKKRQLEKLRG